MFLDLGYQVYVVDQTSVGRGTQEDLVGYPLRIGSTANISEVGFIFQIRYHERDLSFFLRLDSQLQKSPTLIPKANNTLNGPVLELEETQSLMHLKVLSCH